MDGIIIPDLPFEEKGELAPTATAHGVDLISMIAPTSKERIRKIASQAAGFLYIVSSMGVTGVRSEITTDLDAIVKEIREVTDVPCAVGFASARRIRPGRWRHCPTGLLWAALL